MGPPLQTSCCSQEACWTPAPHHPWGGLGTASLCIGLRASLVRQQRGITWSHVDHAPAEVQPEGAPPAFPGPFRVEAEVCSVRRWPPRWSPVRVWVGTWLPPLRVCREHGAGARRVPVFNSPGYGPRSGISGSCRGTCLTFLKTAGELAFDWSAAGGHLLSAA